MSGVQLKMARAALGLGVRETAALSGISTDTIVRLEKGERVREGSISRIRAALVLAGVEFIDANGGGPGVRLARRP